MRIEQMLRCENRTRSLCRWQPAFVFFSIATESQDTLPRYFGATSYFASTWESLDMNFETSTQKNSSAVFRMRSISGAGFPPVSKKVPAPGASGVRVRTPCFALLGKVAICESPGRVCDGTQIAIAQQCVQGVRGGRLNCTVTTRSGQRVLVLARAVTHWSSSRH